MLELVFVFMIVFASKSIMKCSLAKGFKVIRIEKHGGRIGHHMEYDVVDMQN